jgi:hypothetical protein
VVKAKWFSEKIIRSFLEHIDCLSNGSKSCNRDKRRWRREFSCICKKLQSSGSRKSNVAYDDVGHLLFDRDPSCLGGRHTIHTKSGVFELFFQQLSKPIVVFNNQDQSIVHVVWLRFVN